MEDVEKVVVEPPDAPQTRVEMSVATEVAFVVARERVIVEVPLSSSQPK